MNRYYIFSFTVLTAIEIWGETTGEVTIVYISKPLIVLSLFLTTFFIKSNIPKNEMSTLRIAMFFAVCGDVFLMIRGRDLFIPGLASFLIMQWLYIRLFSQHIKNKIFVFRALLRFMPFAALATVLVFVIYPGLHDFTLKIAVIIYAGSIAIMAWMAFLRKDYVPSFSFWAVFFGAMLFMVSDSLIAIGKFLTAIPLNGIWVMSTYAAAQFLITTGVLQKSQTD